MNKIKLYTDHKAKELYQKALRAQISAFNKALEYCEQFVKIEDKKAFKIDFLEYFKKAFIAKYKSEFPQNLPEGKLFELMEVSIPTVKMLQEQYQENFVPEKEPDFNVYATTKEQVNRLNKSKSLLKAIEDLRSETNVHLGLIIKAIEGRLLYDYTTQGLRLNYEWILEGNEVFSHS